ncbi:MAG: hypothetical protein HYS14_03600 [Candidatus Rokubacteria bacterium]|nr:hypothetical protein [Candidatus Rokubacteria bacterium]
MGKTISGFLVAIGAVLLVFTGAAVAAPSAQIFIPSTDTVPFGKFMLGFFAFVPTGQEDGVHPESLIDAGLTAGILPFEKIQAEVGFDLIRGLGEPANDNPLYFNAKLAVPEDALASWSPALAVGGYNFGTKKDVTNFNLLYGLVAKTIPVVGRLSVGYYTGNDKVLVDENGKKDNKGILLSWDRTMSEISDKLWLAIDYQGGESSFGAFSMGAGWKFAPNVLFILGYTWFNNTKISNLENSVTLQTFITFP